MGPLNTSMTGAAGEHFVMFQLLRRGFIAGLAPQNAKDIDILVSDPSGGILSTLQVKMSGNQVTIGWRMSEKHESIIQDRLFYCFVDPGADVSTQPRCWIVPSAVVAKHTHDTHRAWLAEAPLRGATRQDLPGRKMHLRVHNPPMAEYPDGWMDSYLESWELLR